MAEPKAPRGGAVWEFLLLTFAGGALVFSVVMMLRVPYVSSVLWLLWPTIVAVVVARRRGISADEWGLRVVDRRTLRGVVLAAALAAVILLISLALNPDSAGATIRRFAWSLATAPFAMLLWLIPGLLREIPLRGFLLTELSRRGLAAAIILTALPGFFSVGHLPLAADAGTGAVMLTRVTGVGLHVIAGWLRIHAGTVYTGAAFHATWMSLVVLTDHAMPLSALALTTALVLIAAAFLLRFRLPESDAWPASTRKRQESIHQ